jgi:3-methylcrotonyl-CoA carboxylase alpha subunit
MITGTDLVEWQLRVAFGEALPLLQHQLHIHGHAIEARIYAENPEKGFLPSIGTLRHLATPAAVAFETGAQAAVPNAAPAAVRIDSGVREGDAISPFYDPMIAKLIVWGADRTQALARMARALSEYQVVGLATNTAFLKRLVEDSPFAKAELDTGLIERNPAVLFPPPQPAPQHALALAAAALLDGEATMRRQAGWSDPWASNAGWRLNGTLVRELVFGDAVAGDGSEQKHRVGVEYHGAGWLIDGVPLTLTSREGSLLDIRLGASASRGTVRRDGDVFHVFSGGSHYTLQYLDPLAHAGETETEGGRLTAPMPGKVVAILVSQGQRVEKGQPLVIMEAMKMEHTIAAPHEGTVDGILYAVGDQVADGAPLLAFKTM